MTSTRRKWAELTGLAYFFLLLAGASFMASLLLAAHAYDFLAVAYLIAYLAFLILADIAQRKAHTISRTYWDKKCLFVKASLKQP